MLSCHNCAMMLIEEKLNWNLKSMNCLEELKVMRKLRMSWTRSSYRLLKVVHEYDSI